MAECMAEIEQGAFSIFALVAHHDAGLRRATAGDGLGARRTACKDLRAVSIEPIEEGGIAEKAIFDDLGVAGREFARGQSCASTSLSAMTSARLMKGTDKVLAVWGELMPVLPPTEESTWASSEVGI